MGSDFYGRIGKVADIPSEDVQKYILATSLFAKGMQTDINHYVTRDKVNNASFRQKLDPISENILRRQNPLELVFEDISTFDAENPIVGSLLRELDVGEKDITSDLIIKAPGPSGFDFVIQNRLNKLKENTENNNNNNLLPPPSLPPTSFFQPLPPPPPPSPFSSSQQYVQPPQPPQPPTESFNFPPSSPPPPLASNNHFFGSHVMTKEKKEEEREKIIDKIDDKIYEIPDLAKLELGDQLLNTLGAEAEDILEGDFVSSKELEDKTIE